MDERRTGARRDTTPSGTRGRLTSLQRRVVHQFVCGEDEIRGNATAAYKVARGKTTTEAVARASSSRMLTNVNVQVAIQRLQRQADAQVVAQLVAWKTAAAALQPDLIKLCQGKFPDGRTMDGRDDAAVGQVILGAMKEILDRGYPKKLTVQVNPHAALLALIGGDEESLPPEEIVP